MASYVENSLMQGERVLHGGQLHWILMVQPVGLVCLGLVGAVVGCFYPNLLGGFPAYGPGAIVALFGLFGILMAWIRRFSTELAVTDRRVVAKRSEEHTSELQSLMRISYAVFCLKKKKKYYHTILE